MAENATLARPDVPHLTAAEIAALGLSLAHLGAGPQSATARRALRRLLDDLPPATDLVATTLTTLTRPLDAVTAQRVKAAADAISSRRVVRLHYADAYANVTIREVEPVTVLVHRDHWYLVGWCRLRRHIRAFRFDRMLAVEPTEISARPHLTDHFLPFQPRTGGAGPRPGTPGPRSGGSGRRGAAARRAGHGLQATPA